VTGPLIGWAFIGTGIFAWLRRPENRFGALMTAVGFSACLGALRVSTDPWVFIDGLLFIALPYAVLFHVLPAFPSGALESRAEGLLVVAMYVSAAVVHPIQVLFQDTARQGLPENPLLVAGKPDLVSAISDFRFGLGLALLVGLAVGLARRWRASRGSQRAAFAPVVVSGGLVMGLLGSGMPPRSPGSARASWKHSRRPASWSSQRSRSLSSPGSSAAASPGRLP
jgi:hypothetical protein